MKVTGPNSGAPGAGKGAGGIEEAARGEGKSPAGRAEGAGEAFAEKLGGAPPVAQKPGAAAARGPLDISTAALAADIQAGRLPARAALEKVLEQVLARQVGADAPPALREQVRAALRETLESDPLLADKLRSLEG
jgi:hypothetical protein